MLIFVIVASGVVTAAAVPLCMVAAHRFQVIDRPGPLKPHEAPVPYLGGVAVFAGMVVGAWVGRPVALIPIGAALALGVADDRFGLPARLRLVAQLGVGVIVALTTPIHLTGWVGIPLLVAMSVVLINGCNLLDGLDMLAAGVGGCAAVGFAAVTHGSTRLLASSLAAALAAFLWYNRPPARIYLGDGGSYLLGTALTVLLAGTWAVGVDSSTGIIAIALVIVPLTEVGCAVVRRKRSHSSLFAGDRAHPYDLLVRRGWSRTAASVTYVAVEAMMVAVVWIMVASDEASDAVALAILAAATAVAVVGAALVGGLRGADATST